tara:strand:+ start:207 stop:383 length:177 start_codon:yes stop_codon:yes gene_type:complete
MKAKKYKFFSKIDSKKEPIGTIFADNYIDALEKAAMVKNLNVIDFEEIYSIELFNDRS